MARDDSAGVSFGSGSTRFVRVAAAAGLLAGAAAASAPSRPQPSKSSEDIEKVARAGPPWSAESIDRLAHRLLGDPGRFYGDAQYRRRALGVLSRAFPAEAPPLLREMLLFRIAQDGDLPFDDVERLQFDWGAAPRRSALRREEFRPGEWRFAPDDTGRIEASIYSLPSAYLPAGPAEAFLASVRQASPGRTTLVLVDPARRIELDAFARDHGVVLLDTLGRDYTPWPRDTFSLVRRRGGEVRVLVRPPAILQEARLADNTMGRELIKDLPENWDRSWGRPRWAVSPVPFHNGQVILTPSAAWISIHTIEPRILQMLSLSRVPVESFARLDGVSRYLAAARRAAAELSKLYARPVRFIHPLPESGTASARHEAMTALGGGAGFDLDSIVTLLARGDATEAIVGDLAAGRDLLRDANLDEFCGAFGLSGTTAACRSALLAFNGTARPADLSRFLDVVADHLGREKLSVKRLPLFLVPVGLLADRSGLPEGASFSITWNNVVLERDRGGCRAEGFSNLIAAGDDGARRSFEAAGCRLVLFPPLIPSIVRNGGYRCASNHLRTALE